MIARLVIGHGRTEAEGGRRASERFVSGDMHPGSIRAELERLHGLPSEVAVATWSPVALEETVRLWRATCEPGEEWARIFLRSYTGHETALVHVRDPGWLAHFSIADLFLHGEIDPWSPPPDSPPGAQKL